MPVKILITDDQPLLRKGVKYSLQDYSEFEIVGEAGSGTETINLIPRLKPDIVLLDLLMPNGDGIETTAVIRQRFPEVKVLILTMSDNENDFLRAIKAGACGYLLKTIAADEVVRYLRMLTSGDAPFSPKMTQKLLEEFRKTIRIENPISNSGLSNREKEILQLASEGCTNKEIAVKCYISETTVKAHFRNIMEKLDVRSRAGAVGRAMEKGILARLN